MKKVMDGVVTDMTEAEIEEVLAAGQPSSQLVIMERDRRFSLGFDYDFGDARGVHHFGTTAADMDGWDDVTKLASAAINTGAQSTEIAILTETGPVSVTAQEWQSVLLASGQHRQPIWAGSFALQAMTPIPNDFTDDSYWS